MTFAVSPARIALIAAAMGWPLLAALAVVMWSQARARRAAGRGADLDQRLRSLYRTIELRGTPPRLAAVIDARAEAEAVAPPAARMRRSGAAIARQTS